MSIVSGGKTQIAANLSAIPTGDNIASYLVDAAGALLTSTLIGAKQRLDVVNPSEYAEDAAHTTGDYGSFVMGVRSDAGGSLVSADGDYSPFSIDNAGRLRVAADLSSAFDFVVAEDSAATSGDNGGFMLSVRRDTVGAQTSADGDYAEFQTNAVGKLRTVDISDSAILQQVVTVGGTAVALPTAALAHRESMMIQNLGTNNRDIYIGAATVTTTGATRGPTIGKGGFITLEVGPNVTVYGIASGAGAEAAILEMA